MTDQANISAGEQEFGQLRALIIYYSLTGQSRGLINLFAAGMRREGVLVSVEKVRLTQKLRFPFGSIWRTLYIMLITFLRIRMEIAPLSETCSRPYDLYILAGPTWSYNPSGPILRLLDRDGVSLFRDRRVVPLISCRGYYRVHNYLLRWQLRRCGAQLEKTIHFQHPVPEPWSTIGVFLKSAGYHPERSRLLGNRYPKYGHTAEQLAEARSYGSEIGKALIKQVNQGILSRPTAQVAPSSRP